MPPQNGSCPAGPGNAAQRKGYQQGYHGGRQGRHERPRLLGKLNTTPDERILEDKSGLIKGIRPCQWLVGYPWSTNSHEDPLWLTASICYDATDLGLMADLRCQSDVLAIPAFNRDVKTFDQMALALHYHMFQLVVVVNNGTNGEVMPTCLYMRNTTSSYSTFMANLRLGLLFLRSKISPI